MSVFFCGVNRVWDVRSKVPPLLNIYHYTSFSSIPVGQAFRATLVPKNRMIPYIIIHIFTYSYDIFNKQ